MSTLLQELVSLRDGHLFLDGGCRLTRSELHCMCVLLCMLVDIVWWYIYYTSSWMVNHDYEKVKIYVVCCVLSLDDLYLTECVQ